MLIALWFFSRDGFVSSVVHDPAQAVPVERFTLTNGLEVVVMPNARVKAVAHLLLVRAGAADDPEGKTGLAHYLEHLMFTGTKEHPEGAYEKFVLAAGGEQNAYTTRDYTGYYTLIASDKLADIMALEVDRLKNLTLDPKRVARELHVITEERQSRVDTNPSALFLEQLQALSFLNHPYRKPTIGWPEDMAKLTAANATEYFNSHYVPSNMLLVVAGEVTAREVKRLAEKTYGTLSTARAPQRMWAQEPNHLLAATASMADARVNERRLFRQYCAPSVGNASAEQVSAHSVLAYYLGGGEASFLRRRLVLEQQLASAVDVDYDALARGPALLRITATPRPSVTLPQLKLALDAALDEVRHTPPSAEDLNRAKTNLKASVLFAQDGLLPLAQLMGDIYMSGADETYFYAWPKHVEAVSAEAVRAAAEATLKPQERITGYLLPQAEQAEDTNAQ